ncbi:MAG: DUF3820 family protein [Bacteroidia bacterium]|jgi:uncharacterized protein
MSDTSLPAPDAALLLSLGSSVMPFGKYKDYKLKDIPVYYLEWMARNGFPKGKLGMQLQTLHVIKTNGLEYLLKAI